MSETVWETAFVIGWLTVLGMRAYYTRLKKKNRPEISYRTPPYIIIAVFGILLAMLVVPMLVIFTPWLALFSLPLPGLLRAAGLIGFFTSIFLFRWVHASLGTNFSQKLEILENHQLITDGPYKYVRHPMYLQFLLWVVSQGLLLANSFVLFFGMAAWVFFCCVRVPPEEKIMRKKFGEAYGQYALKTGCLFPKIKC